jgi:hypothetical protein
MQKIHSPILGCPYCGHKWPRNLNAEEAATAFESHRNHCETVRHKGINGLPEALNAEQMHVVEQKSKFKGRGTPAEKWKTLYECLFPGSVAPSPCKSAQVIL